PRYYLLIAFRLGKLPFGVRGRFFLLSKIYNEAVMKRLIRWSIVVGIVGVVCWLAMGPGAARWKERNQVTYREVEVSQGKIVAVVNATGTVKPVRLVTVGTFVSGPIESIKVDFNQEVAKNEILATIDQRIYLAAVARDKASLDMQQFNVKQTEAKLQQAINDEERALALRSQNKGFISDSEMDQFKFNRLSLKAQLEFAKATVLQAEAVLDTSNANLEYTVIRSPVDGVIIDRKIDPGQTVAASFQTPDLFVVAPDLRKEVYVYASVDESDISLIREAQLESQLKEIPVRFTIDTYPNELFEGKIHQIRQNSTTIQNVVTYPVIVSVPNPDLKLIPGMTANMSFQVGLRSDKLRIPNAALRFFPQKEQVRLEDRKLLEGFAQSEDFDEQSLAGRSAEEKAESRRLRNRRHVWVQDGEFLRAIEIITGLSDNKNTEVVSGDLQKGMKLVTGIQIKK
ncbi:MAG TPA: efflux RND transporter periplasmic adaptor subunit, partial [Gemmataceae bacterium]|nr:efflux RND transporter periplasmic adaptor subunit [Gemmataceae bacterium]